MIEIRNATSADLSSVYDLICALEETHFSRQRFASGYASILKKPEHIVLVASEERNVIGMLHLRMEFQLHHVQKTAEILELIVQDTYRGHGIGASLFAAAETVAKENNCCLIEVTSHQRRKKAHQFYMRQSMERTHFKLVKNIL